MEFYEYPRKPWEEILTNTSDHARDLVSRLVRYESGDRVSAAQVRLIVLFSKTLRSIDPVQALQLSFLVR